jgi:hypothetical protein
VLFVFSDYKSDYPQTQRFHLRARPSLGYTERNTLLGETMIKFVLSFVVPVLALTLSGCAAPDVQVIGSITVPPLYAVNQDGDLASEDYPGTDYHSMALSDGGPCLADDGYDDISANSQVTVTDGAGEVVGVGRLNPGVQTGSVGLSYGDFLNNRNPRPICAFSFEFTVPGGGEFYNLSVGSSNRGEITYTAEELATGIFLTLGG